MLGVAIHRDMPCGLLYITIHCYTDKLCFVVAVVSSTQQTWRRCDTCGNSRTRFRMHAARDSSCLWAQMPPDCPE
jgi:hypothetical protein